MFVWVPWNARTTKIRSFFCMWILITDTQHYCFRRHDTVKLLEENTGKTFSDINHTSVFLSQSPKIIEIKAKINKWALIKLTSFCTTKEAINKTKIQPMDWGKMFANDATKKDLISKAYKQLINSTTTTKLNNPTENGQKTQSTFFWRRHGDRHMKRGSSPLTIKETQISTMRYHLTLIEMAIIKKSTNNKCWRGGGEKEAVLCGQRGWELVQPLWRTVWKFLKKNLNCCHMI